jgi:hypothetical protein
MRPDGGRRRVPGTPEAGGWVNGVQDFETNSSVRTSTSIVSREGGGGRLETWVRRVLAGSSVCYKTRQNKNVCRRAGRGIEGFDREEGAVYLCRAEIARIRRRHLQEFNKEFVGFGEGLRGGKKRAKEGVSGYL